MPESPPSPSHLPPSDRSTSPLTLLAVVGIDVGGTKTHIRVVDTEGAVTESVTPSDRWRQGSLFTDDGNFDRLGAAVGALGLVDSRTVVVAGVHGCDTDEQMARATGRLEAVLGASVTVVNDALLLHHATPISPTIEMIVGTGAVISGTTAEGDRVTVDGYGWPLGDRGSSHDLVSAALRATLGAWDRGEEAADALYPAMLEAFQARDAAELAERTAMLSTAAAWGNHASVVFEQAAAGSSVAADIVDEAASDLARGVAFLIARGATGRTVVAGGGVIVNQAPYEQAVRRHLARILPEVELVVVRTPPVHGAVEFARELRSALVERSEVSA